MSNDNFFSRSENQLGKAKQKNASKINTNPAPEKGGRLYLDISSINTTGLGGSKFWCLVFDEISKMKWSFFLKSKLVPFLKDLHDQFNKKVQFVRCNNSGENQVLQTTCKQESIGITFEFTAP
jgi:hypothetical protein